jgi:hypothetical protein
MTYLHTAALNSDAALDLALMRIGILAPADLGEIRMLLTRPNVTLQATCNRYGHCIVEIVEDDETIAELHHDGRLTRREDTLSRS